MLLTVLVVIGLFWSVDRFRPIFATICFLGYVAVLQWLSQIYVTISFVSFVYPTFLTLQVP